MKKNKYKKIKALDQIILILLLFSFIKIMQTKSEIKNELIILFLEPVNLKRRLSEVYSLPLVKFLTPPTRSVLCTPRMFFLTLEKY